MSTCWLVKGKKLIGQPGPMASSTVDHRKEERKKKEKKRKANLKCEERAFPLHVDESEGEVIDL